MLTSKQVTIKVNSGDAEVTITVDADNRIAINNPATEQSTQEMLKRLKAHAAKSEQEDVEEYNNKFVQEFSDKIAQPLVVNAPEKAELQEVARKHNTRLMEPNYWGAAVAAGDVVYVKCYENSTVNWAPIGKTYAYTWQQLVYIASKNGDKIVLNPRITWS